MMRTAATLAIASLLAACGGKVEDPARPTLTVVGAASLDFGTVVTGTSRALEVTLANPAPDGASAERMGNISIGISGAGLSVEHDCPGSLDSDERCTIRVEAEPLLSGALAGILAVASDAKGSPHTLAVTGRADASPSPAQAAFAWAQGTSGDLGTVTIGRSGQRSIVVRNLGNLAGQVQLSLSDPHPGWQIDGGCAVVVEPGASCAVQVTFTPATAGAHAARLVLGDGYHDGFAETRLELTATAVEP